VGVSTIVAGVEVEVVVGDAVVVDAVVVDAVVVDAVVVDEVGAGVEVEVAVADGGCRGWEKVGVGKAARMRSSLNFLFFFLSFGRSGPVGMLAGRSSRGRRSSSLSDSSRFFRA
jgi:hypothetical protein